jgi:hypothetical protein
MRLAVLLDWLIETAPTKVPRVNVAKYGIGFCPGCHRLRSVASVGCIYCGDIRAVRTEDA